MSSDKGTSITQRLLKPPWRTVLLPIVLVGVFPMLYLCWSPGELVTDGRHDKQSNGIWLQHGWLGDDSWFTRNNRDTGLFRNEGQIRQLATLLSEHHIKYVYPHLCPCSPEGQVAAVNDEQLQNFLSEFEDFKVLPWVGGVLGQHAYPSVDTWRDQFISSILVLLEKHPRLAGIHINIEPIPSGNPDFIILLKEIRERLGEDRILSVAAYPPPTRWHKFEDVHWDEGYYREVCRHTDQIAVMMYDTAIQWEKVYRNLMAGWTTDVLAWSEGTDVLLGIPAYDDSGVDYHNPDVENLLNGLAGIHAGLKGLERVPEHYKGVAIYSEWEMDETEWGQLREFYLRSE